MTTLIGTVRSSARGAWLAGGALLVLGWFLASGAHARGPAAADQHGAGDSGAQTGVIQTGVILITGSTDGLGRALALELAEPGSHIIVHGRSRERGLEVVRQIEEAGGSARFYQADLGDLDQVRALGEEIRREYDRLDVVVNNAGIWLTAEQGRQVSAQGHELHFAVNYLSHFLLTRMLLPLLIDSAPARIVNVASAAQQPIDFADVMLERSYTDGRAYAQSKLAQILSTFDLAAELAGTGVTVNALHPATMMNTTMVLSRGAATRSSVEEGLTAVLNLISSPEVGTGEYYNGTRRTQANQQAYDEAARERLRQISEELIRGN
jgi:NAD(P)-dependent dehydrogenase (short-subunit alcohol dehydrogenase family)